MSPLPSRLRPQPLLARAALAALLVLAALDSAAAADAVAVATPVAPTAAVADAVSYRAAVARHLYAAHAERVARGKLPPLLYAIAIVDVDVDEDGHVVAAVVDREPASAKEVMPWILGLIRAASPFPKPGTAGRTRYRDIWLVDRDYTFQLDTLTEGQR